jgi:hypothetical protein
MATITVNAIDLINEVQKVKQLLALNKTIDLKLEDDTTFELKRKNKGKAIEIDLSKKPSLYFDKDGKAYEPRNIGITPRVVKK